MWCVCNGVGIVVFWCDGRYVLLRWVCHAVVIVVFRCGGHYVIVWCVCDGGVGVSWCGDGCVSCVVDVMS